MKKTLIRISILLSLTIILFCSISVFAEGKEHRCAGDLKYYISFSDFCRDLHGEADISLYSDNKLSTEVHISEALEAVRNGVLSQKNKVNFSRNLDEDDADMLAYTFYNGFCNIWIEEYITNSRGNLTGVRLAYSDEFNLNEFKKFSQEVDSILCKIEPDMTDLEKAITVYDHMQQHYRYDTENYSNDSIPPMSYSGYGIILNRVGVCQAYAEAYQYLLSLLDIPCNLIVSWEMDHAWNVLYIDGAWYQADVTWDDGDVFGDVRHNYFLFSDYEAESRGHSNWEDYGAKCDNTQYDEQAIWRDAGSSVLVMDGYWYYMNYDGIFKYSSSEKTTEKFWSDENMGGGFEYCNGKFYYTKAYYDYSTEDYSYRTVLCAVDALTLEKTESDLDILENSYGFHICGKDIFCSYIDSNDKITSGSRRFVDNIFVRAIALDTPNEIYMGKTISIGADVKPVYADNRILEWSVNDDSIAQITQDGRLTVVKEGIITVTATASDGSGAEQSVDILITQPANVPVASVTSSKPEGILPKGSLITLSTDTVGAQIYYTTDGSVPTEYSEQYNYPIEINQSATIKAMAVKEGRPNSCINEFSYEVIVPCSMEVTMEDYSYQVWNSGAKELSGVKLNIFNSEGAQNVNVFLAIYDSNNRPLKIIPSDATVMQNGNNSMDFSDIGLSGENYRARVYIFGTDYEMFPFGKLNSFDIKSTT